MGGGDGGGRLNLGGGGMGGRYGGVSGGGMGHMGHMGGGGAGHMGRMARGDFNGGSNWHGRNFAHNGNFARNNWNGNWDRPPHFITGFLSEHRSSMAAITPITATATARGCGGKPSSPEAPICGGAIRASLTFWEVLLVSGCP